MLNIIEYNKSGQVHLLNSLKDMVFMLNTQMPGTQHPNVAERHNRTLLKWLVV